MAKMRSEKELDILISYGIEGTHYNMKDGKITTSKEQIELRKTDGSNDAFGSFIPKRVRIKTLARP
jgi:hypothetical protein